MCGSCKSLSQARLLWWTLQKLRQWPEHLSRGEWHEAIHFKRGLLQRLKSYATIFLYEKIMQVCGLMKIKSAAVCREGLHLSSWHASVPRFKHLLSSVCCTGA